MRGILSCLLALWFLSSGYVGAQCALGTQVNGYVIGWVRDVESMVDDRNGCLTDITVDVVRSNRELGASTTLRMLGGWCEGAPMMEGVTPGGRRTFSAAIDELALLVFCQDEKDLWILDKGTLWGDGYPSDTTGVRNFVRDVSERRVPLEELRVYRNYRQEVLRSPDPTTFYRSPQMRRETWFLQQVKIRETPEPTVREVVDALDLID